MYMQKHCASSSSSWRRTNRDVNAWHVPDDSLATVRTWCTYRSIVPCFTVYACHSYSLFCRMQMEYNGGHACSILYPQSWWSCDVVNVLSRSCQQGAHLPFIVLHPLYLSCIMFNCSCVCRSMTGIKNAKTAMYTAPRYMMMFHSWTHWYMTMYKNFQEFSRRTSTGTDLMRCVAPTLSITYIVM